MVVAVGTLVAVLIPGALPAAADSLFVVNSTADDNDGACQALDLGDCTFREAVAAANANADLSTIHFAIPGEGPHTIVSPGGMDVRKPTVIDATTQPGASCPSSPMVELRGTTNNGPPGIQVYDTGATSYETGVTIRGLSITNFGNGIQLGGNFIDSPFNTVECNLVGLEPDGVTVRGNQNGISGEFSSRNRIGGPQVEQRNVVSGNAGIGIQFRYSYGHVIAGNYVGTDASGTAARGNGDAGVYMAQASGQVGGATAVPGTGMGNVVAANGSAFGSAGVGGFQATLTIQGNRIGELADGTPAGNAAGVAMAGGQGGLLGGTGEGEGNIVAHSTPMMFSSAHGVSSMGNCCFGPVDKLTILGNSIHSNAGQGIFFGFGANDALDADSGVNDGQNHPLITSASLAGGNVSVDGTLHSNPSETFTVEVFANDVCDPSGRGEGRTFVGRTEVTTNESGDASFSQSWLAPTGGGLQYTATATDADGNSSEFSPCVLASEPSPPPLAVTAIAPGSGSNDASVTATLTGTGFTSTTAARLVGTAASVDGTGVTRSSATQLQATFSLTGVPAGVYDVRVADGDDSDILIGGFTVTQAAVNEPDPDPDPDPDPLTQPTKRLRPDGQISKKSGRGYIGGNVYNTTAASQTVKTNARRGAARTFFIRVQNDGNTADSFRIKGCRSSAGFRVTYLRGVKGTKNVTRAVVAGTYTVTKVPAAAASTLRMRIAATATAKVGAAKACRVLATSRGDTTKKDAVRGRVTARR